MLYNLLSCRNRQICEAKIDEIKSVPDSYPVEMKACFQVAKEAKKLLSTTLKSLVTIYLH